MNAAVTPTTFTPGPTPNTVRAADGTILTAPDGWVLLPPGDAGLTRRVKAAGDHWVVQEKRGRKTFSRGIWAPAATIERIRAELEAERSTEGYARRQEAASRRREQAQAEYVEDFHGAVLAFLAFHSSHADLADRLARAVTEHATPVGSGTVARTQRIPVEQRAEAAVIAWMRHQTTGYDNMAIPRVKGKRREVRRMLARRSQELLARYRRGEPIPRVARSGRRWRPNRLPDESTGEPGEVAVAEEEKLKLGKGAAFDKGRLKRLSQRDETWEADFRALPKPIGQSMTEYRGMVVTEEGGSLLSESHVHGRPSVNDLATILANAMRRPLRGRVVGPRSSVCGGTTSGGSCSRS